MSSSTTWYDDLREKYRPDALKIVFVGESPPDPGDGERRYFYSPTLSQHDNLFRNIAQALYGDTILDKESKVEILNRLQRDGYWLIDAVKRPNNKLKKDERRAKIKAAAPQLVERCLELAPAHGVIICTPEVYVLTIGKLLSGGVNVLHMSSIPFPLYGGQDAFKAAIRQIIQNVH